MWHRFSVGNIRCLTSKREQGGVVRRLSVFVVICGLLSGTAFSEDLSFGSRDARPVPSWLHSASIYELWLNAFSKEGNLRGAIPALRKIADLGATIVYLGPIAKRSANP